MIQSGRAGFTIVELLIVIVVIGILAAITLVAFGGVRDRAHNSSVQSDLATLAKKLEVAKVEATTGQYPTGSSVTSSSGVGFSFSKGAYDSSRNNLPYCRSTDGMEYGVAAISKGGAIYYISSSSGGVREYTWAWTGAAANTCPNILSDPTPAYSNQWGLTGSGWQWAN